MVCSCSKVSECAFETLFLCCHFFILAINQKFNLKVNVGTVSVMWTWVPLLLAALSILQTCQQEVEPSEPETPGSEPEPLNLVDNSTLCFNVKPAACGATEEKETCLCQALNPETVYCCFITNPYQLNNNLRCAGNGVRRLREFSFIEMNF